MAQMTISRCDCCGQVVDLAQFEFCPICQYPVSPAKEQHFLETSIRDLQRVVRYGGSTIRVLDLLHRYEGRLQFLHAFSMAKSSTPIPASEQSTSGSSEMLVAPAANPLKAERAVTVPSLITAPAAASRDETTPLIAPVAPAPGMPIQPAASMRGFTLSGDAMVNVLAAVGGFLVLAGVLGTVFVTSSLWLSFLVVLGIHAAFGTASLVTRRSTLLRAVSPLYTIIFALLVPLLAFSAYRLVENNLVALSVPYLLTLSALYAAVIYGVLAVVQRFVLFAYLGSVALLVGDLAFAQALNLVYWWWPVVAMALPLAALLALPRPSGPDLFAEQRAILRTPLLVLMYTVIGGVAFSAPLILALSLLQDSMYRYQPVWPELHLALFVLSCLFVLWYALWLWRTRQVRRTPLLAYLCLVTFWLLGYVFKLDLTGYVLVSTGVALCYHALVRAARQRFAAYGFPGRTLDGLAIGLVLLVLLQTSASVPFQLIYATFVSPLAQGRGSVFVERFLRFSFTPGASQTLDLIALGVCLLVTLDMALARAGFSKTPTRAGWCWLLLLSGSLLSALYGLEVLLWQVYPLWALLAFSLGMLACAVLVRRFAGSAWAYPLELLTLVEIAFTLVLSLSQHWTISTGFLLACAALLYVVLFAQRRPLPALLPGTLLLLSLVSLQYHLLAVLAMSLLLPLLVAGLSRAGLFKQVGKEPMSLFAWTLLVPALICGLLLAGTDANTGQSVFANWASAHVFPTQEIAGWLGTHVSAAYEIALLGIVWYGAALLARARLWLLPATLFWLLAMFQPVNNFWVLSLLTPALAVLGVAIEKRSKAGWALPFYLLALSGAGMVVFSGFLNGQVTALSWFLLGYALLAYAIGLVTDHLTAPFLTVLCATLAVYIAASQTGDLYRPPIVALVCAGLGLVAGRVAPVYGRSGMRYALPFYASGLAAALLTGIYGMLGDLRLPFYGAIVDALFLYALVASIVVWIEQRASWNWLVALFACWGVLLTQRLTVWYVLGAGIALVLAGLLSEQLVRRALLARQSAQLASFASEQLAQPVPSERVLTWPAPLPTRASWLWPWPWYSTFLVAALVLGSWPLTTGQALATTPVVAGMFVFTLLALVVMLERHTPELLVFPVALATWSIYLWQSGTGATALIIAYILLCVLIYAGQFIWGFWLASASRVAARDLHHILSLGGLCAVLLFAVSQGALSSTAGALAQAGIMALVTLSVLIFFYGLLHPSNVAWEMPEGLDAAMREAHMAEARAVRHRCNYIVGLLLSLAVSWELLAAGQTRFDTLTLVPASYLIVIAPFLLRDQTLPKRRAYGQRIALLGSALLLLPALWFSFQGAGLLPTLILLGESLLLLLLGLVLRMRVFILSSAALIIVGTLRLLFISMPPSVPILLLVFGSLLMALATALILSRHRLQAAWSQWE